MAKDSFQFRQFTVRQQRCAMKVGTDGVLLGAWAAAPSARILDIGTGTGLIALMMAQRYPQAAVTAIDISPEAVLEARDNVSASPFADRIRVECIDVCRLALEPSGSPDLPESSESPGSSGPSGISGPSGLPGNPGPPDTPGATAPFDAIVCNPPYFADSLQSPDDQRTLARHTASLTYAQLIAAAWRLLSDDGRLSLIIPADCRSRLEAEARLRGFFLTRLCAVKTTPRKPPKRYLMEFRKHAAPQPDISEAILETSPGERSPWYRRLTDDFYIR